MCKHRNQFFLENLVSEPKGCKMQQIVYLNDELVPADEAKISVFDSGFLYGNGLFETMRAYSKRNVFRLRQHLERLFRSAELIGLNIRHSAESLEQAILDTLTANHLDMGYVRLTISPGVVTPGSNRSICGTPTVLIVAKPLTPYPEYLYKNGASALLSQIRRNVDSPIPRIKSLNFLENILARAAARDAGTLESIFLDTDGYVVEGSMSNLFFVKDGVLQTPSTECPILPGITRAVALEIAAKNGIPIREGKWKLKHLLEADEAFLTNSLMELMPLVKIDSVIISEEPGRMTQLLAKLYKRQVELESM